MSPILVVWISKIEIWEQNTGTIFTLHNTIYNSTDDDDDDDHNNNNNNQNDTTNKYKIKII